jgi:hypothetical protein
LTYFSEGRGVWQYGALQAEAVCAMMELVVENPEKQKITLDKCQVPFDKILSGLLYYMFEQEENCMKDKEKTFEERKEAALRAARAQGIVDVVQASDGGISLETLELATRLTKKHAPSLCKRLEKERKSQK